MRIPKGKGDGEVEPPLGGTGADADDGAGADDAEARDDEAVAPLAVMLSCDMPVSTHCRECWLERLLRWAGRVGVTGLCLGGRSCRR